VKLASPSADYRKFGVQLLGGGPTSRSIAVKVHVRRTRVIYEHWTVEALSVMDGIMKTSETEPHNIERGEITDMIVSEYNEDED
jgi:hypothetical protein